jgi:hypothetical protein
VAAIGARLLFQFLIALPGRPDEQGKFMIACLSNQSSPMFVSAKRFVQRLIDFLDSIRAVRALILGGQTHERS